MVKKKTLFLFLRLKHAHLIYSFKRVWIRGLKWDVRCMLIRNFVILMIFSVREGAARLGDALFALLELRVGAVGGIMSPAVKIEMNA
jgi:hypothetical protein